MALRFLAKANILSKILGALLSSDQVIKASRNLIKTIKREYQDLPESKLKDHLIELEIKVEKVEENIADIRNTLKKISILITIIFIIIAGGIIFEIFR